MKDTTNGKNLLGSFLEEFSINHQYSFLNKKFDSIDPWKHNLRKKVLELMKVIFTTDCKLKKSPGNSLMDCELKQFS